MFHKIVRYGPAKALVAWRSLWKKPPNHDKIAVCALFQNDADFLEEWIYYHLLQGVDHFFLYNNNSSDHFAEVLKPFEEKGLVSLRQAPQRSWFMDSVVDCYNDCLKRDGNNYRWMAFLDSDEFIIPEIENVTLKEIMRDYIAHPAVFMNWLIFGTSGVQSLGKDEYMIEKMSLRCPDEHDEHLDGKCIVQPSSGMLFFFGNVHYPEFAPWQQIVYADGQAFAANKQERKLCLSGLQLNHYWYRTEDFYQNVKIPRRISFEGSRRNAELEEWHRKRSNSTPDKRAVAHLPRLKRYIANYKAVTEAKP